MYRRRRTASPHGGVIGGKQVIAAGLALTAVQAQVALARAVHGLRGRLGRLLGRRRAGRAARHGRQQARACAQHASSKRS